MRKALTSVYGNRCENDSPDGDDRMKVRDVESSVTEILLEALGMLRNAQRLFLVVVRPGIWPGRREGVDGW